MAAQVLLNKREWDEEIAAAAPIVAAEAADRAQVVADFLAGKPTYGPPVKAPVVDPNDLSKANSAAAAMADLATLKSDGTVGDGHGPSMTAGQYITLADGSKAHYKTAAWAVGAFA